MIGLGTYLEPGDRDRAADRCWTRSTSTTRCPSTCSAGCRSGKWSKYEGARVAGREIQPARITAFDPDIDRATRNVKHSRDDCRILINRLRPGMFAEVWTIDARATSRGADAAADRGHLQPLTATPYSWSLEQ